MIFLFMAEPPLPFDSTLFLEGWANESGKQKRRNFGAPPFVCSPLRTGLFGVHVEVGARLIEMAKLPSVA
jgi:hypothetical protein